jgi:hypothetical protein
MDVRGLYQMKYQPRKAIVSRETFFRWPFDNVSRDQMFGNNILGGGNRIS